MEGKSSFQELAGGRAMSRLKKTVPTGYGTEKRQEIAGKQLFHCGKPSNRLHSLHMPSTFCAAK